MDASYKTEITHFDINVAYKDKRQITVGQNLRVNQYRFTSLNVLIQCVITATAIATVNTATWED